MSLNFIYNLFLSFYILILNINNVHIKKYINTVLNKIYNFKNIKKLYFKNKDFLNTREIKELKIILVEEQNYICPICRQKYNLDSFTIDHIHNTKYLHTNNQKYIRGAICRNCNIMIGKIENMFKFYNNKNNINLYELLFNIMNYLYYFNNVDLKNRSYIHYTEIKSKKLKKSCFNKIYKKATNKEKTKLKYTGFANKYIREIANKYNIELEYY